MNWTITINDDEFVDLGPWPDSKKKGECSEDESQSDGEDDEEGDGEEDDEEAEGLFIARARASAREVKIHMVTLHFRGMSMKEGWWIVKETVMVKVWVMMRAINVISAIELLNAFFRNLL